MLISRMFNRLCPILAFWLGVIRFIPDLAITPFLRFDGSDTSLLTLRMDFLLGSYWIWLLVVLPFNPALICWLLPKQTRGYAFTWALEGWDLQPQLFTHKCNQLSLTALAARLTFP
ncbi:hypothetical protein PL9631_770036 [Planktothrix paucivesiculata PCC 9631]|uniref:Uncharacterized protein n=1 Tax=Planktothrix paucivesiculata PCC 9631 TaxID=671071 RepID=A0A7Z9BYZ5_9CYAN|nr:hypothetical protein PL9631_770036 [Planktothrix paucivesiculata PCC 9631]